MITIKSDREIKLMMIAGNIVYETHKYIKPFIKEGITTKKCGPAGRVWKNRQP